MHFERVFPIARQGTPIAEYDLLGEPGFFLDGPFEPRPSASNSATAQPLAVST